MTTRRKTRCVALDARAEAPARADIATPAAVTAPPPSAPPTGFVRMLRGTPQEITAPAPDVGHTTWNQIARRGTYEGHPQGAFAFDDATIGQIVVNFGATANGRVPVDYEHTSEVLPANAAQQGVPAVAWVTALDDRGDAGLWAAFEWVDAQAVEYVRTRRYLYVSPAVNFDSVDRVSGESIGARLTSVALTNHPFLDGMVPLAATSDPTRLGLAPGDVHIPSGVHAPEDKMSDNVEADKAKADAEKAEASPASAMSDDAAQMSAAYQKLRSRVMEMAGTDPEAGEDVALEKLEKLVAEMQAAQKVEAAQMSARLAAAGLIGDDDDAKAAAVALYLRDKKACVALFGARLEAKQTPAPKGDDRVLLTGRTSPETMPPSPTQGTDADGADPLAMSRELDTLATRLMSEGKHKGYSAALSAASAELATRRTADAMSRLRR